MNQATPTDESDPQEPGKQALEDAHSQARMQMVDLQLAKRDIHDARVLDAMRSVPRHLFVPPELQSLAYRDSPLPIGDGQTISQPYIVALMTQLVQPMPDHRTLDVGTGSGYQAAVLSGLVQQVFSIEIVESLASSADQRLKSLGYQNITVRHGDGYAGWKSEAPFNVIIVAAAPKQVPQALVDQLAPGGKMVIPVGGYIQTLVLIEKQDDGSVTRRNVAPVAFVPMTGRAEK